MEELIALTEKEKEIRDVLIAIACGARSKLLRDYDDESQVEILVEYEVFAREHGLSQEQLEEALTRISLYDWQNGQAPMLESLLCDTTRGMFGCSSRRQGFFDLMHQFYGVKRYPGFHLSEELAQQEMMKCEWYWGVSNTLPDRLLCTLKGEHICVRQEELMEWTREDLPGIMMRVVHRQRFVNIRIRYIVMHEKQPFFDYANYGNFFFLEGQLFVLTTNEKYRIYSDTDMRDLLLREALKVPCAHLYLEEEGDVDCFTGEVYERHHDAALEALARQLEEGAFLIRALYAGTQTDLCDAVTHKHLYTGDIITVGNGRGASGIKGGLCERYNMPGYCIEGDNHYFPIDPERKLRYYHCGSLFHDLQPHQRSLNIRSLCCGYAQRRGDPKLYRAYAKASPCYHMEEWQWRANIILGAYNK